MQLKCDCGNDTFLIFGPYPRSESDDKGLRKIYTCTKCGDQLRVYQASIMYEKGIVHDSEKPIPKGE